MAPLVCLQLHPGWFYLLENHDTVDFSNKLSFETRKTTYETVGEIIKNMKLCRSIASLIPSLIFDTIGDFNWERFTIDNVSKTFLDNTLLDETMFVELEHMSQREPMKFLKFYVFYYYYIDGFRTHLSDGTILRFKHNSVKKHKNIYYSNFLLRFLHHLNLILFDMMEDDKWDQSKTTFLLDKLHDNALSHGEDKLTKDYLKDTQLMIGKMTNNYKL